MMNSLPGASRRTSSGTSRQSASIKISHYWSKLASVGARQSALVNARLRPLGFRPVDLEPAESEQILVGDTIDLDGRRGMAAQKATRMRRQLSMVYAADAALRQEELDILLAAAPATGWGEAVAKARYLLILFAQTPAAEDPRRATLIADVFADFKRLLAESNTPAAGDAEKGKAQDRATAQAPFGLTRPETGIRQLNPRKC
jgi:hypothetical protein